MVSGENPYAAPDPVLRFDSVGMRYGRAPEVLRDLTFKLEPGSFHFVTGASGAGKSSLLKLIYLAHRPSRGLIRLFGSDLATTPARDLPFLRRRIGVVFQEFRLLDHLSAFDNAALPLRIAGRKPTAYRKDVAELLGWVGLGERMHAMPATLSGGEKQRLAIARAVVGRPDLLLADEPTGNVDEAMGARILRLFTELNRHGTTVVIATHDRALVEAARQPVLHLEDGRLVAAPASALVSDPVAPAQEDADDETVYDEDEVYEDAAYDDPGDVEGPASAAVGKVDESPPWDEEDRG